MARCRRAIPPRRSTPRAESTEKRSFRSRIHRARAGSGFDLSAGALGLIGQSRVEPRCTRAITLGVTNFRSAEQHRQADHPVRDRGPPGAPGQAGPDGPDRIARHHRRRGRYRAGGKRVRPGRGRQVPGLKVVLHNDRHRERRRAARKVDHSLCQEGWSAAAAASNPIIAQPR